MIDRPPPPAPKDFWRGAGTPIFSKTVDRRQREIAMARELHPQLGASPAPRLVDATVLDKHVPAADIGRHVGRREHLTRPASADVTYNYSSIERAYHALEPTVRGSVVMRPSSAMSNAGGSHSRPRSSLSRKATAKSPSPHSRSASPVSRPASVLSRGPASWEEDTFSTAKPFDPTARDAPFNLSTAFQDTTGTRKVVSQHVRSHFRRPQGIVPASKLVTREQRARSGYSALLGPPEAKSGLMAPLLRIKYDALADWKKYAQFGAGAGAGTFERRERPGGVADDGVRTAAQRAAAQGNSEAVGQPLAASLRLRRSLDRGYADFGKLAPRPSLWDTFGSRK